MHVGPAIRISAIVALLLAGGFALVGTAAETPRVRHLASYNWSMDRPWFGGWSGVELSADGSWMAAITDRGRLLTARIERDGDQITGVQPQRSVWLKSSSGKRMTGRIRDSEGLAVGPGGDIFVSFEGVPRVGRFTAPGAPSQVLGRHQEFLDMRRNKALEALAVDRSGRLYTVPERVRKGRIDVYVLEGKVLTGSFTLPGGGGFLPVGADFGPDGRFYLLERSWGPLGFRSRLRRWELNGLNPGGEELLLRSAVGQHGNLEGMAVWTDDQGRTRITMLADDNFKSFQRTEIVEYVVTD